MNINYKLNALICVVLWGFTYPLYKLLIQKGLSPLFIVTARFYLGTFLLIKFVKIPKKYLLKLFFLSFTLYSIPITLTAIAVKHVDASIAALTTLLDVPFAWILSVIILKEKIILKQCIGLILSSLGLFFVVKSPEISGFGVYFFLLIFASFLYGLAAIQIKFIDLDAKTITACSYLVAAFTMSLISVIFEDKATYLPQISFVDYFPVLLILTLMSLIAFYIWSNLLKKHPVNEIVSYTLLIPVSSLIIGYFLIGETTHPKAFLGGLITITGVWLQTRVRKS